MHLPTEFILPDYDQSTIANLAPTLARWFDVPFAGLPPLKDALWQPVAGDVQNVVVILIDALGWNLIQHLRAEVACLTSAEINAPITSVFPSTTCNALSSVWTGTAPAQHGLVGFKLFLQEYGTVAQMIGLSPVFLGMGGRDVLAKAGMQPEEFLAVPGSAEQLTAAGITVHDFKGREIVHSALSKMHGRGVTEQHGVISFVDMLTRAKNVLEHTPQGKKQYLHLYWPTIDMLSHTHGAFSQHTLNEARMLLTQIDQILLNGLSPRAREGTLVCVMADHGHTNYDKQKTVILSQHPELQAMLLMQTLGGIRFPYLFAKQGKVQAVIDYINTKLSESALAISAEQALAAGLLGQPPFAPNTRDRLGDVVVLMRDRAIWVDPVEEPYIDRMISGHGGLSKAEMEAPWLVWRVG